MTKSLYCTAEINIVNQLYFSKNLHIIIHKMKVGLGNAEMSNCLHLDGKMTGELLPTSVYPSILKIFVQ